VMLRSTMPKVFIVRGGSNISPLAVRHHDEVAAYYMHSHRI
jgi:hypothetical protein